MRSAFVAAAILVTPPLAAQDNSAASAPAPAAASENIGPRELSNFSLNGTVTREAEPAASASRPAERVTDSGSIARGGEPAAATAAPRSAPSSRTGAEPRQAQLERGDGIDPITSRPTLRQPSASTAPAAVATVPALSTPIASPAAATGGAGGFSPLPWIAALLVLGAGAVIYFGLRRRRRAPAMAGAEHVFEAAPEPAPPTPATRQAATEPLVRRPVPEAAPAPTGVVTSSLRTAPRPSAPPGVVTSSLRPWIEVELEPSQALITEEHAAIAFDVTLFNSGSAPARDVAIEACLFNASQQQDAQLSEFYTMEEPVTDKIPAVAPMARVTLKSAVRMPRSAVQEYEVEGRKLFMPMVAINSRYRWSSGEGQSAASFLVGKAANDGERLTPLRLGDGPRGWKSLAARRYEKGIRR